MSNYTFPTQEQFFEDIEMLEVIKKRGTRAAITDFSILLGGYVDSVAHIAGDNSLASRTGYYLTRSDDGNNGARVVNDYGSRSYYYVCERFGGARPALPFSSIDKLPTNGVSGRKASDGVLEVEYGFYPQSAVSRDMQQELERQLNNRKLSRTGNGYTTDSRKYDEYDEKFKAQRHEEFEYRGKRYIRVVANTYYDGQEVTLSNGEKYRDGDPVWVEVEPIKWLVSERDKLMLAEKIIFAGVQFKHERDYHTEDFGKTDIKKFIDDCWSKDIEQVRSKRKNYGNWY